MAAWAEFFGEDFRYLELEDVIERTAKPVGLATLMSLFGGMKEFAEVLRLGKQMGMATELDYQSLTGDMTRKDKFYDQYMRYARWDVIASQYILEGQRKVLEKSNSLKRLETNDHPTRHTDFEKEYGSKQSMARREANRERGHPAAKPQGRVRTDMETSASDINKDPNTSTSTTESGTRIETTGDPIISIHDEDDVSPDHSSLSLDAEREVEGMDEERQ